MSHRRKACGMRDVVVAILTLQSTTYLLSDSGNSNPSHRKKSSLFPPKSPPIMALARSPSSKSYQLVDGIFQGWYLKCSYLDVISFNPKTDKLESHFALFFIQYILEKNKTEGAHSRKGKI